MHRSAFGDVCNFIWDCFDKTNQKQKKVMKLFSVRKKKPILPIIIGICALVALVALVVLRVVPAFQWIAESVWCTLIVKALLSAVLIYFTWFYTDKNGKPPMAGRWILTVISLLPWVSFIFSSYRIQLLIQLVCFWVVLLYVIYASFFKHIHSAVLKWTAAALAFINLFPLIEDYTFVDHLSLPFWQFSLIFSLVVTVAAFVLLILGFIRLESEKTSELLAGLAVLFIAAFGAAWCTACNLNYALDNSEPMPYETQIIHAEAQRTGARSPIKYIFTVTIEDNETEVCVSFDEFLSYNVGDTYEVLLCRGAFSEPYYTASSRE